jgi:hypothetical protein
MPPLIELNIKAKPKATPAPAPGEEMKWESVVFPLVVGRWYRSEDGRKIRIIKEEGPLHVKGEMFSAGDASYTCFWRTENGRYCGWPTLTHKIGIPFHPCSIVQQQKMPVLVDNEFASFDMVSLNMRRTAYRM